MSRGQDAVVARAGRPAIAALAAVAAFGLYYATLLPGLDFGDTAFLQATVGSPILTPRHAYPLYFAMGDAWLRLTGLEPARALNLLSALHAAAACGLLVLVGAELCESTAAALAGSVLVAASYTFWSQAVIAEVYALHVAFIAATLLLLLRWSRQPTTTRLALFLLVYAIGFGNHLSMVLLAPAYAAFILLAAPGGWRAAITPRVVGLATACAAIGALQYAGSFYSLWLAPHPPTSLVDGLGTFWFDVTKADWRDTLVFTVPRELHADHAAMYWFDLRQQFGIIVPFLATIGLAHLAALDRRRAALLALLYVVNVTWAFNYNVGDAHVFYLPSHVIVALLAACGVSAAGRWGPRPLLLAGVLVLAFAGARAYRDYPALDRSRDTRATDFLRAFTKGLDDVETILLSDLNWQVGNGLSYFAKVVQPEIAHRFVTGVLAYVPTLVTDNRAVGRQIAVTERAREAVAAAYGSSLRVERDGRVDVRAVSDTVRALAPGSRYVLCLLRPSRDQRLDEADVRATLAAATGAGTFLLPPNDYVAIAGRIGEAPSAVMASDRPFRRRVSAGGVDVEVRMDSWLSADTIRRMGFGHVIVRRVHTLIVERGMSFVSFDERGTPQRTAYGANIFAAQPRHLISIAQD